MAGGEQIRRLGFWTAAFAVVADMVGTGVFTTTGFLVADIGGGWPVLAAWAAGGLLALCGALVYGELAAALPRNGGEYHLLGRLLHPAAGFAAGVVSVVVGFAAPLAAAALAFGRYLAAAMPGIDPVLAAVILVALFSVLHGLHVRAGGSFQNVFTALKIALLAALVAAGLVRGDPAAALEPGGGPAALLSPGFAVGLVFISFAYAGWNGAVYLAGEVRDPARTLPRALLLGTGTVAALYLGLNVVFLGAAPAAELAGVVEVGHVAATRLFGEGIGRYMSLGIALVLVSCVSAQVMAGARVAHAMSEDCSASRWLRYRTRKGGGPLAAALLQGGLAIAMVLTATFDTLLAYIGFTLAVSTGLTVFCIFRLRRAAGPAGLRESGGHRVPLYPLPPLLFLALSVWMLAQTLVERPAAAFWGLGTIALSLAGWRVLRLLGFAAEQP